MSNLLAEEENSGERKMGKVIEQCDLCGDSFQYGTQRYDGQYLPHYEMFLCEGCYKENWDGFTPGLEAQFIAHMKSKGIALPERNDEGCYPR